MVLQRTLYDKLCQWRKSGMRKPLLLQGARQTGKSYLLEHFAENEFESQFLFNFEKNPGLKEIFKNDLDPQRIIRELSLAADRSINPESDIVIFDEIQESPRAISSLKYFSEEIPELALAGAGSLLGVKLSTESFPVGKVEFLHLYPLSFTEFLQATGDELLLETLDVGQIQNVPAIAHNRLWHLLKEYFIAGGMPQVVEEYLQLRATPVEARRRVRELQRGLLDSYYKDFAKHSGAHNAIHIVAVFENIPMQLAGNLEGSVNRYKFKDVIAGKKGFTALQGPIEWLIKAGLVIKVKVCNRAEIPLEAFCKPNIFKLFIFDIGLLGCLLDLPVEAILNDDYGIAKGYFAENFVAQELQTAGRRNLYSWTERNSEIEFLITDKDVIVPLEVKSGMRTQAKSMQQYIRRYSPSQAVILSKRNFTEKAGSCIQYLPLYMAGMIPS
ncbi:AAA family ATPase [bacterium]|nr:AAA family ATPase [bacterium]